jgi:hypothetical protein
MKLLFVALFALAASTQARADSASHRRAAESVLELMDMETVLAQAVDQTLKAQIQANPAIAPYEQQMRAFFAKYMSWASLKSDFVTIYANEFTEDELNQIAAFYRTPVGRKAVQKLPVLLAQGAALGSQRVQDHLPELRAALMKATNKP